MVSRGQSYGVIEVVASSKILDGMWLLLEIMASQGSIVLRNLEERGSLRMQAEAFDNIAGLSRTLVAATSPESAVKAAVRSCYEQLKTPIAGWLMEPGDRQGKLVAAAGLGDGKRRSLMRELWPILSDGDLRTADLSRLERRFGAATGVSRVETVRTPTAVLLVGGVPASPDFLDALGPLLDEVLRHLDTVALAERRNQELDLGIAWTAHELRTPLLALRGFLDLEMSRTAGEHGERAYRELEELLQQIDGLLRWATGTGSPNRRRTDLMKLIHDVTSSYATPVEGTERISIEGPEHAPILVEPGAIRQALSNVVRNALRYSPSGSMVAIRVRATGSSYVIGVSDRGPGVSPSETEAIFDPFVRGDVGRSRRGGRGLGLFIARRVLDAHGGGITVEPGRRGATFKLRLPREGLGEMASAS